MQGDASCLSQTEKTIQALGLLLLSGCSLMHVRYRLSAL